MNIKIYYLHSWHIENADDVKTDGFIDNDKVKLHPEVKVYNLPGFIDLLNKREIDIQGIFAFEDSLDLVGGFSIDDVYQQAEEDDIEIDSDQAERVMLWLHKHGDSSVGISWDTISDGISEILKADEELPQEAPYIPLTEWASQNELKVFINIPNKIVEVSNKDGKILFSESDVVFGDTVPALGFRKHNAAMIDWYIEISHDSNQEWQVLFFARSILTNNHLPDQDVIIKPTLYPEPLKDYAASVYAVLNFSDDTVKIYDKENNNIRYDCDNDAGLNADNDLWFGYEDSRGNWDLNVFLDESTSQWAVSIYEVYEEKTIHTDFKRIDVNIIPKNSLSA